MITLHIEPRVVKTWDQFLLEKPAFSVALDGYVKGPPSYDFKGPRVNFNHHEGVDRLATRCTAAQVYMAIKQGFFKTFCMNGEPLAEVFVNDPDQDVCVAFALLQHPEWVLSNGDQHLLTRLVSVVDLLDTAGGMFPIRPDSSIMEELAWVFEPYTTVRVGGRVPFLDEDGMQSVILGVASRIEEYLAGNGKRIPLDTRYEILGGDTDWKIIREIGGYARSKLLADGVSAFVAVREREKGRYSYTLGRVSPFVSFPIIELLEHLNTVEGLDGKNGNSWGGGDTIGGSPRMHGSGLSPKEIEKVIRDFLKQYRGGR